MLAGCGHKPPSPPPSGPPQVSVLVLEPQEVTQTTELPGRTNPLLTSDVRPQVNGIVKARLFTEGGDVRVGQVLYQIDPAPYRATLDQSRGQLAGAQANLLEQAFVRDLDDAVSYRIADGTLELRDAAGAVRVRLEARGKPR